MNRKILVALAFFLVLSMILTPFAFAKPGAEKNNEKFEYFELICSGTGDGIFEKFWFTPPNADPLDNKTAHVRGGGWITGETVELTVDEETFNMDTAPYSVDWTTTYDADIVRFNNGSQKLTNIRLTDVVTVYDGEDEIGTIVLNLRASIDFTTFPPGYGGTAQGYGTGELTGIHISGIDLGLTDPVNLIYSRVGTITGWPEYITNTS